MKLNPSQTAILKRLLAGRNNRPIRSILAKIEPADVALLLAQLDRRDTQTVLEALVDIHRAHLIFQHLPPVQVSPLLERLSPDQLTAVLVDAPEEAAAELLATQSEDRRLELLEKLDPPRRRRVQQILSYPVDSAGRLMQLQVFRLPSRLSVEQGLQEMRAKAREVSIYYIYCVDEMDQLEGVVSLRLLATSHPTVLLKNIMKTETIAVAPENSAAEVANIVSLYDFVAIPVVDAQKKLLGVITIDDVLDIIQEQAGASLYAQVGLKQDDRVYSSIGYKVYHRVPWMLLNLALAAVASSVVSVFETTMHELILLASVKNIVAGLGGNTAIQTLTVMTRGLATGDFNFVSRPTAVMREFMAGTIMGLLSGLSCGLMIYLWKQDWLVAVVICLAMFLNSVVAALFGALVPLMLDRFKRDPATGSGVIVTMITDIFGFFSFLGIANLFLHWTKGI